MTETAADANQEFGYRLTGASGVRLKDDNQYPQKEEDTRLNVRISPKVRKALEWIASIRGVSNVEAVRKAIGTERFFLGLREKGARIYVKMPYDRELQEVVFTE